MQASCEFCEIFKNTFFTEHLRTTASDFKPVFSSTQFTLHTWSFYIRWIYISYDANSDCFGYDSQNENRTHEWIPIGFNNSGATLWKKRLQYRWDFFFFFDWYEIFKSTYFEKYHRTAASENLFCATIWNFKRLFRRNSLSTFYKIGVQNILKHLWNSYEITYAGVSFQ